MISRQKEEKWKFSGSSGSIWLSKEELLKKNQPIMDIDSSDDDKNDADDKDTSGEQ